MRILIYGINYAPELTGIGKYTGEMGAWLAGRGHAVSVITTPPYYPDWRVLAAYPGKGWHTEQIEGVTVYRCPLYVPRRVTPLRRIIHEFSFVLSSLPAWGRMLLREPVDVVICPAPPFHLGFLPLLYAWIKGAKVLTHVQDLQVDAAKELGMIRNERLLNLLFAAERGILRRSTAVSTISEGMRRKLIAKGLPPEKVQLFPNWVDAGYLYPLPKSQSLRQAFGLTQTERVILYAGNLGEKQGLEILVEVAEKFRSHREVVFVLVGSGGGKENLKARIRAAGLQNVRFFPLQPYEKMSALLAAAEVHLVLQKKSASDLVMPSKLSGIMAAGGCALVTALPGTSLYDLVDRHQTGILVEPESVEALFKGITQALSIDLDPYRANALAYAQRYLQKDVILGSLEQQLLILAGQTVSGKASLSPVS